MSGIPCFRRCVFRCGFCTVYGHKAFRFSRAPNKGMRRFLPNRCRAYQSRGGPWQEGGAATRHPPNGSRPRERTAIIMGRPSLRTIVALFVGCLLTLGALSAGLMAFRKGRKQQSQIMMRFRIFAQGFTIFALLGGVAWAARQKPEQKPIVAEPSSSQ
uniref:HIG1 domain-containing protein n=1 Tax=Eptatretus burgeri TaxID=7764 RepID=A0A8C4QWF1_EPTBU